MCTHNGQREFQFIIISIFPPAKLYKNWRTDSAPFIIPLNTLGLGFNQNSLTSPSLNSNETVEFFKLGCIWRKFRIIPCYLVNTSVSLWWSQVIFPLIWSHLSDLCGNLEKFCCDCFIHWSQKFQVSNNFLWKSGLRRTESNAILYDHSDF